MSSENLDPTEVLQQMPRDALSLLYFHDYKDEDFKSIKTLKTQQLQNTILHNIMRAGTKLIGEDLNIDALQLLLKGFDLDVNKKKNNPKSRAVLRKRLQENLERLGLSAFLDQQCDVEYMQGLCELYQVKTSSSDKDELIELFINRIKHLGFKSYLESLPEATLREVCLHMDLLQKDEHASRKNYIEGVMQNSTVKAKPKSKPRPKKDNKENEPSNKNSKASSSTKKKETTKKKGGKKQKDEEEEEESEPSEKSQKTERPKRASASKKTTDKKEQDKRKPKVVVKSEPEKEEENDEKIKEAARKAAKKKEEEEKQRKAAEKEAEKKKKKEEEKDRKEAEKRKKEAEKARKEAEKQKKAEEKKQKKEAAEKEKEENAKEEEDSEAEAEEPARDKAVQKEDPPTKKGENKVKEEQKFDLDDIDLENLRMYPKKILRQYCQEEGIAPLGTGKNKFIDAILRYNAEEGEDEEEEM